ncbi:acyltransferase ChoActase/COT/CPT [Flagelloscypha sp. PMI_526]|nr:acyltransferase ChoActase/COT/CPT [Flagelloscypha sp. PMI_526]
MPFSPRRSTVDLNGEASNETFKHQDGLPKLPIPPLEDTCRRYLTALEALQDPEEHAQTKTCVDEFLRDPSQGPRIQARLQEYAKDRDSYIEEFWYESYLHSSDPVVLSLNPFFVLENDPHPVRSAQVPRAASLISSSLGFIHDLRKGLLSPDMVRSIPLDMDQYTRLFGTARVPTPRGCHMDAYPESNHIVILRRGQQYWFEALDDEHRPLLTERELIRNIQAIVKDADDTPRTEVAKNAIGVLTTENRKIWSSHRDELHENRNNAKCLEIIDQALFIVCIDDDYLSSASTSSSAHPPPYGTSGETQQSLAALCANFLCGTYHLENGVQVGTCTNRWYDKLQIIVCQDGSAGINFEHTGVDGHTVLRFAADVFTEGLMGIARSINPQAPTLFHAKLSPRSREFKPKPGGKGEAKLEPIDTTPKKLVWKMSPELRVGIKYAETRLSDLICQNDCQSLEFRGYGKNFITSHGLSPDAFVQMAIQAAYFGLYGRNECVYEPAMTKAFLHGRTEAIRSLQPDSVHFTKTFFSDATPQEKVSALRKACERHVKLTKECSQGLGQDRHLYALYCLLCRELEETKTGSKAHSLPPIFSDPGWETLSTSILSTSNCGNPALRLFGFGPVAADGYGIGYIIKEDGLSFCASSKHLQTRRFLDTLQTYFHDVQKLLIQIHRSANERPAPFVDHAGVLRDSKTGRKIDGYHVREGSVEDEEEEEEVTGEGDVAGYSFFDTNDVALLGQHQRRVKRNRLSVGKVLQMSEY